MTVAFGVPLNVIVDACPTQTFVLAMTETVGNGATVMVTVPVAGCVQPGDPVVVMLTRLKVLSTVKGFVMVAFPEASNVTVLVLPLRV